MKVFLQVAAFVACSVSSAVVLAEAAPDTNRFQIGSFTENGVTFHGEVALMTSKRDTLETLKCTECVGHHGLCTIGEGNCYAPDGCFFCGDCGADKARCQDPPKEGCQCY